MVGQREREEKQIISIKRTEKKKQEKKCQKPSIFGM